MPNILLFSHVPGRAHTSCRPGTYRSKAGTSTSNAVCTTCSSGTYSSSWNWSRCYPWAWCGKGYRLSQSPTSTRQTQCACVDICCRQGLQGQGSGLPAPKGEKSRSRLPSFRRTLPGFAKAANFRRRRGTARSATITEIAAEDSTPTDREPRRRTASYVVPPLFVSRHALPQHLIACTPVYTASASPASLASTRTRQATRRRPASRGRRAPPATTPRAALQPATGSASTARRASTRAGASPCSFLAATRQIQLLSCCDALTHGRSCCLFQIRLHRWNLHVLEHVHGWAKRVLKAIGHGKQSKRSKCRPVLPCC